MAIIPGESDCRLAWQWAFNDGHITAGWGLFFMFNHGREDKCFWDDNSQWDAYKPSAIEAGKLKDDGVERRCSHTGVFRW